MDLRDAWQSDRRIAQKQRFAAFAEVLSKGVDLGLQVVGRRTGDDQHGRVGRHLGTLGQHDLVDGVVVALQYVECARIAGALHARAVFLAVPLDEVGFGLPACRHLD